MKIKCPHCKKTLTDDEIKAIWGQFVSSKTKGLTTEKKKKASGHEIQIQAFCCIFLD